MRLFWLASVGMLGFLLVGVGLARGIAQTSPTPDHVRVFLPDPTSTACPAPCWNGINTDRMNHKTTVDRILSLPQAQAQGLLNWQFTLKGVQRVRLEGGRTLILTATGVRVGDVIAAIGLPETQTKGSAYNPVTGESFQYLQFFYLEARLTVTALIPYEDGRLSPLTPAVLFTYPAGNFEPPESQHPWQGWVWLDQYYLAIGYGGYSPTLILE